MRSITAEGREVIIKKALQRKEQTLAEIAKSNNIGLSTLGRWIRAYQQGQACNDEGVKQGELLPSIGERLEHILAAAGLDEGGVGAYCRSRGIYPYQLEEWKQAMINKAAPVNEKKEALQRAELKALRAENRHLKRDLQRKDRALAETSALLVLKKKADLIWGVCEDDT